ncbi:MAG: AMP-binding protein, partial [Saprospiraceae bacterium]|nr:AMP-binding protein [Saprospiraceae bacterium]
MSTALSYASGPCDHPLIGSTIGRMFDDIAEIYPTHEALVVPFQNVRWTYAVYRERVDALARALLASGVRKGDRVGIWSPNCAEWAITQFATAKLGAILVNINPSYRTHELEYVLNQSECQVLIAADAHKYSDYTGMLLELAPELHHCRPGALISSRLPSLRKIVTLKKEPVPGMICWADLLARATSVPEDALEARQNTLSFDDPINIQYTSGTTGFPKGATLSHHNILNNA